MTFSDRARAWAASMARFAQRRGPRRWLTLLLVVLGLSWLAVLAADGYAEWLWFAQLGHTDVLLTRWLVSAALLMAIGGLSLAGLWGNLALAHRFTSEPPRPAASRLDSELQALLEQVSASLGDTEPTRSAALRADAPPQSPHWFDFALHAACVLIALAFGLTAIGSVENLLRWLNGRPFGVPDPIFGRDVAFSIFALPLLRPLVTWLGLLVLLTAGAVGIVYGRGLGAQSQLGGPSGEPLMLRLSRAQRTHVASLGAALLVALALAHQVARADLVFSTRGRAVGIGFPGYADAQVQAPAYVVMSAAAVLSAILLVVAAWRGSRRLAWRPVAGYGLVLVGGLLLPLLVQVFVVLPNDVVLERPYLEQAIRLTRQAFAVEEVREEPPPPPISDAASTIDLPLWSQAAIRSNLNQVQALQPYYAFSTAQVDRYPIGGQPRLVLVGARELNPDGLPSRAWSTIHLQFTHGYGAAVALAASASPDGGPEWLTDFPTQQPEIYFGERTTTYAVVNTSQPEQDVTGRYSGRGIRVGGGLRRLAFALALRDPSLLLTQAITSDSELLYERQVQDRVRRLAPFLLPEPEAYLVIADGRLV
ncbi:MAG TPA: UPF0182 family protein, partial [Chloroflexota bacterium]|nr:UPF0182 family protein [Chloroflexota bacterium]